MGPLNFERKSVAITAEHGEGISTDILSDAVLGRCTADFAERCSGLKYLDMRHFGEAGNSSSPQAKIKGLLRYSLVSVAQVQRWTMVGCQKMAERKGKQTRGGI